MVNSCDPQPTLNSDEPLRFTFNGVEMLIDPVSQEAFCPPDSRQIVPLTALEFDLLHIMTQHTDRVFKYRLDNPSDRVWQRSELTKEV